MESRGYPYSAVERAMKGQEVILRAIDGRLKWYQAAEAHYEAEGRLLLTPQGIISTNGRRGQITLNNRTDHVLQKPDILTCPCAPRTLG